MFYLLILFTTIIELCHGSELLQCQIATANKYLGYFSIAQGTVTNVWYNFTKTNSSEECREECRLERNCYAASYSINKVCLLYNTTYVNVRFDNSYDNVVYVWYRCNWEAWSKSPADGRCTGMFIGYYNMAAQVAFTYMVLHNVGGIHESDCQNQCSENPICRMVNYDVSTQQCILYQGWPDYYVNVTPKSGNRFHQWTCIPNYFDNFLSIQTPSKINGIKCTGYWNLTERNITVSGTSSAGAFFYTQSLHNCLAECNANLICNEVLFNMTFSVCILPRIDTKVQNQYYINYTFARFRWICTKNDSRYPPANKREEYLEKMGMRCVRLLNNTHLYISEDDCGRHVSFVKCRGVSVGGKWQVTDSCIVGQVFWKFEGKPSTLNITGHKNEIISKMFTGLTTFWLVYVDESIFNSSKYLECRRFDGSHAREIMEEGAIVSRARWFALKPRGKTEFVFTKPLKYVIIDSSEIPYFGCRTVMTCSSILRNLQIRYFKGIGPIPRLLDAPYNFMLDENGVAYAVRGWTEKCVAFPDVPDSFCLAFIGSFSDALPTIEFLNGARRLINLAVSKGYLDRNYSILLYGDVTNIDQLKLLTLVAKNWYRYRGYVPKDCSNMSNNVGILNFAGFSIVSIIAYFVYLMFFGKSICKKCEFLHAVKFSLIYSLDRRNDSLEIKIPYKTFLTKCCIITEKSPIWFRNEGSKLGKVIKVWFLNVYLETYNSKLAGNHLGKVLNDFQHGQQILQVYECDESNQFIHSQQMSIALCFEKKESFELFNNMQKKKGCFCQRFSIDYQTFSPLGFNN